MIRLAALAGVWLLLSQGLRASPVYLLRHAFTSPPDVNMGASFVYKQVAGMNDADDVCGSYLLPNTSSTATATNSVYFMNGNGAVYDLFPYGLTPAVNNAWANGISPQHADGSVQIVGYVKQADGFQRGAVWNVSSNGAYTVQILENAANSTNECNPGEQNPGEASAINSSGLIVGYGWSCGNGSIGLYWYPPYSTAPGEWNYGNGTTPAAVNDQNVTLLNGPGKFAGGAYTALFVGPSQTAALPVNSVSGPYEGDHAYAMSGSTVVGTAYFNYPNPNPNGTANPELAFVWKKGDSQLTLLPEPPGMTVDNGEACSVNSSGDILGDVDNYVGNTTYPAGRYYVLWKNKGGTYQPYVLNNSLFVNELDLSNSVAAVQSAYEGNIQINNRGDIAVHYLSDPWNSYLSAESVRVFQAIDTGVVQFTRASFSGDKSNASVVATVKLFRADGYTGTVTAHYTTSDGDAVAGKDYLAQSGTLTWNAGQSGSQDITIPLPANFAYWTTNKTLPLRLSDILGAEPGVTNASMVIVNDDTNEKLAFVNGADVDGYNQYNVEAGATNLVVTLTRAGPKDGTMVIQNYGTQDGDAYADYDYQTVTNSAPITWNPGQPGSLAFPVPLLDSSSLTSPLFFTVYANGTIDGTNYFSTSSIVNILPPGQTPPFPLETSASLTQSNALHLLSYVEQGVTILIQSSSNLVSWRTVTQLQCTNGVIHFNPSILTSPKARYYRAVIK